MNCPECGAEIFEGDKFCGECGHNVSHITSNSSSTENQQNEYIKEQENTQQDTQQTSQSSGNTTDAQSFFNEGWSMIKRAFIEPARAIISKEYSPGAISVSVIAALLLIYSLLAFITLRSSTPGDASLVPVSVFFYTLLYTVLICAIFFFVTFLMNKLVIKKPVPFEKVLYDFSITSIIVISLFIVGVLLNLIALFEIGFFFFIIGAILFTFSPLYILLRYAENNNTKLDSYYSVGIYIIFSGIAYYIIFRIMITQAANTFFNEFNYFF